MVPSTSAWSTWGWTLGLISRPAEVIPVEALTLLVQISMVLIAVLMLLAAVLIPIEVLMLILIEVEYPHWSTVSTLRVTGAMKPTKQGRHMELSSKGARSASMATIFCDYATQPGGLGREVGTIKGKQVRPVEKIKGKQVGKLQVWKQVHRFKLRLQIAGWIGEIWRIIISEIWMQAVVPTAATPTAAWAMKRRGAWWTGVGIIVGIMVAIIPLVLMLAMIMPMALMIHTKNQMIGIVEV
jgi:hypothetical protein